MATHLTRTPLASIDVDRVPERAVSSESLESGSGLVKYLPRSSDTTPKSDVAIKSHQINNALKSWYHDCEIYEDSENVNPAQLERRKPEKDVVSETLKEVRSAAEIVNEATKAAEANLGLRPTNHDTFAESTGGETAQVQVEKLSTGIPEALEDKLCACTSELFEAQKMFQAKESICMQLEDQVSKLEAKSEREIKLLRAETAEKNTFITELEQEKCVLQNRLRKLCDQSLSPDKMASSALAAAEKAAAKAEAALTKTTPVSSLAPKAECAPVMNYSGPSSHLQNNGRQRIQELADVEKLAILEVEVCEARRDRKRTEELEIELCEARQEVQDLHAEEEQRRARRCGACCVLRQQLSHASSQYGEAQTRLIGMQEELSQSRKECKAAEVATVKCEMDGKVVSERYAAMKQALEEHRTSQDVSEARWREEISTWVAFYEDAKAALERSKNRQAEAEKAQKNNDAGVAELRAQLRRLTEEVEVERGTSRDAEGRCKQQVAEARVAIQNEFHSELNSLQRNLAEERGRGEVAVASFRETEQRLRESEHQAAGLVEVSDERWLRCTALQDKVERLQTQEIAELNSRMQLKDECRQAEARLKEVDRRHQRRRDQGSSPMSDRVLVSLQGQLDERTMRARQLEDEVKSLNQLRAKEEEAYRSSVERLKAKVEKYRIGHLELRGLYQERIKLQQRTRQQCFDSSGRAFSHERGRGSAAERISTYASKASIEAKPRHHSVSTSSPSCESSKSPQEILNFVA